MKTARERAELIANGVVGEVNRGGTLWLHAVNVAMNQLKAYARDQRHACAEDVNALADGFGEGEDANPHTLADRAHALVMNTPFPGEGR